MGSADRLGVAPNLPSTFANGGRYGSQFEGFGSEPTPDSSEVGDVDRTGCEGLHDGHLLPRRSEDPKPWKAEFAGASDPVKRLGSSQPSNRWSTEGRDRGSPQLATRTFQRDVPSCWMRSTSSVASWTPTCAGRDPPWNSLLHLVVQKQRSRWRDDGAHQRQVPRCPLVEGPSASSLQRWSDNNSELIDQPAHEQGLG